MSEDRRVLIAGGGPVGLFCALLLGRAGIPVRLFDANPCLQDDPRAATTHPATLDVLSKVPGLVEDMSRVGLVTPIFQFWDRPTNTLIAQFDHAVLADDTKHPFVVQCEQFKTSQILTKRLEALANVEVRFDSTVEAVEQDDASVTVTVATPSGRERHTGAWLIGADGGRSTVRKQCGIAFEGFTYEERFLVLTTPFDFAANRGYCERTYIADPDEWCNCFKVSADGPPGLWRTVFPADATEPESKTLSDEDVHARMQKFFPLDRRHDIVHRNLYSIHQRVASTFAKGRVLLAGDSAHVNNSIGGMGLNGGLQDADNASAKLIEIILNGGSPELAELYSLQRRTVTNEFVQAQTIANKKRLEARDPATRERNFAELRESASDPGKARRFLLGTSMLTMQKRAGSITLEDA
ncbi:MAG: FAD-dependent oxidoreductase [Hyphomicrobiaceae bacterium]